MYQNLAQISGKKDYGKNSIVCRCCMGKKLGIHRIKLFLEGCVVKEPR